MRDASSSPPGAAERAARLSEIESVVANCRRRGSVGARGAGLARDIERSTLRLVLAGSLGSALICSVGHLANRGVMRRLRELHRSVSERAESDRPARRADAGVVMNEIDELSERMYLNLQEKNRELLRRERVAGIGLLRRTSRTSCETR
jgi:hypothetical protein